MESPHLALTLQNAWPRITHAICPKLNAAGQAPLMPKLPPPPPPPHPPAPPREHQADERAGVARHSGRVSGR